MKSNSALINIPGGDGTLLDISKYTKRLRGLRARRENTNMKMTAPDRCYCLNQASLTIRTRGRAGKFSVGETNSSQTATDVAMVIK